MKFYTTQEWLRDWLKGKEAAKSAGTFLKYRNTIEGFLAFLGEKAKRSLNQISPREIQGFRDNELAQGKHPNTCNFAVKHLRIPFNVARRQGLITHNPAEAIEMLSTKGQGTKKDFDIEQIRALLKSAAKVNEDWRGIIMVAFYTGARLQDAANLRWRSIDLQEQLISFTVGKTDEPITIPMHPELHAYLLTLPAPDSASAFVFPSLAGKKTGGKSGLSMAFSRIMEKANVRGEVARKGKGRGRNVNTLSFHSLRHSFNSIMANAGVAQEIRQKLTGHLSPETNKRYTHHELAPLRAAISVMPSIGL